MEAAEGETAEKRTWEAKGLDESGNETVTMTKLDADYRALDECIGCNTW